VSPEVYGWGTPAGSLSRKKSRTKRRIPTLDVIPPECCYRTKLCSALLPYVSFGTCVVRDRSLSAMWTASACGGSCTHSVPGAIKSLQRVPPVSPAHNQTRSAPIRPFRGCHKPRRPRQSCISTGLSLVALQAREGIDQLLLHLFPIRVDKRICRLGVFRPRALAGGTLGRERRRLCRGYSYFFC